MHRPLVEAQKTADAESDSLENRGCHAESLTKKRRSVAKNTASLSAYRKRQVRSEVVEKGTTKSCGLSLED